VLVFNGCYHGAVDETHVRLSERGVQPRAGLRGMPFEVEAHTRVVEFNAWRPWRRTGRLRLAAVLCEPALTNMGRGAARARIPRRAAPPDARARHAADHR